VTTANSENESGTGRKRRWGGRKRQFHCVACRQDLPFCWNCPCGFQICDQCLKENLWGLSNGPTWVCPDCGRVMRTY
jgi:hypothetical protein